MGISGPQDKHFDAMSILSDTSDGADTQRKQRGFVIHPPTTSGDDGAPSKSLLTDVRRVFALIQDERHLVAYELYKSAKEKIDMHKLINPTPPPVSKKRIFRNRKSPSKAEKDRESTINGKVEALLESKASTIETLKNRVRLFQQAKINLSEDDDWTISQTLFGITTSYRREDDGSLSIKIEGTITGVPLFEQLAVLREIDLYSKWSPFCTSSLIIKQFDKLDTVGWFVVGLPKFGLMRDGCFRAIGCDCITESGNILIVAQGVADRKRDDKHVPDDTYLSDDPALQGLDIPPVPTRMGGGRMTIRNFEASVDVLSATDARTKIAANINPNLDLIPKSLMEYVMKKLVGILLNKLQKAARKAQNDPVRNPHARKMREENAFYEKWLLPKFQNFAEQHGWGVLAVSALQLGEEEKKLDLLYSQKSEKRMPKQAVTFMDTNGIEPASSSLPNITESKYTMRDMGFHDDHSQISELSNASMWSNNPIAIYLKEVESKTQAKKEKKLVAAREKADDRLKRKRISPKQEERLKQLKDIKARRRIQESGGDGNIASLGDSRTASQPLDRYSHYTSFLNNQSARTRLLIIMGLFGLMCIVFYYNSILGLSPVLTATTDCWWLSLLRDVALLIYLGVCAGMHFLFCDVALVHAFQALELGVKSGRSSKKYYNDMMRVPVGVLSGGLVGIGIVKALLLTWFRMFIWFGIQSSKYGKEMFAGSYSTLIGKATYAFPEISPIISFVEKLSTITAGTALTAVSRSASIVGSTLDSLSSIAIRSHWFGRTLENMILGTVSFYVQQWKSLVHDAVGIEEGTGDLPSWRLNAVESARSLLLHTAVFLLSIIFLFNATIKPKLKKNTVVPRKSRPRRNVALGGTMPTVNEEYESLRSGSSSGRRHYSRSMHSADESGSDIHHEYKEDDDALVVVYPYPEKKKKRSLKKRTVGRKK